VLAGGLTGTDYFVEERPVVDPDELFLWFAEADGIIPPRPVNRVVTTYAKRGARKLIEFHVTGDIEVTEELGLPPISGGSAADIPGEVPTGCATDMAPHTPQTLKVKDDPAASAPPRSRRGGALGQASVDVPVSVARNRSATATCIAIPAGSADSFTRIRGE
jgi:hypothetical protein